MVRGFFYFHCYTVVHLLIFRRLQKNAISSNTYQNFIFKSYTNNTPVSHNDYIVKLNRGILGTHLHRPKGTFVDCEFYKVPSKAYVLHRIIIGPDGNPWFTELGRDRVGTLKLPGKLLKI